MDEPGAAQFPQLAEWAASLQQRAPNALRFINLLPNYGPFPTEAAYAAYVDSFVSQVKPDILCFDHYPMFGPGSETSASQISMAGYMRNLHTVRSASLANGNIPYYNFFNTMPYDGRPDVTEVQLRWQAFTSLTFGSKGVLYFCYWSPSGSDFAWGNAIMRPQTLPGNATPVFRPGPHYHQARAVNAVLRVAGGFLFSRVSTGIQICSGGASTATVVLDGPASAFPCIANISGTGAGASWAVLVGGFSGSAIVLHNQQTSYPSLVTVGLRVPWEQLKELDLSTGASKPVANDAPDLGGLGLYLNAADIRVFQC
jgi:hypothetical protein